jgi:hypothetical protein
VPDGEGDQIGYQALSRGVPVHAADGPKVGTVHRVLGIVISTPEGRRFVDAPEVARIAERRVTLSITAAEAGELPEHQGARAVLGTSARRTGRRWRRRLGL